MEREGDGLRPHGTLVLFPGALGDAVCVEPTVRWLARDAAVTFCARGGAAEVAALFPSRPRVGSLDAPEIAWLFAPAEEGGPHPPAWLEDFAAIVSFTGAASSLCRARLEATGRAAVLPFPERCGAVHACDEMLARVGAPVGTPARPSLIVPARETRETSNETRPGLVVHPGSGGAQKRVPEDLLGEVAARWRSVSGGSVTVLLGPAEQGEDRRWEARVDRVVRPGSVLQLAALLSDADAYVGGDSGPSHVAAALGIPATIVFTATDPGRFGPRGARTFHVDLGGVRDGACARVWEAVGAALP